MVEHRGFAIAVGVALALLVSVQCDVRCKGTDGRGGLGGIPGRDGQPGMKGEKGEPAKKDNDATWDPAVLRTLKGDVGSRGLQGPVGPKGYRGDLGPSGRPGQPGLPGPEGASVGGNRGAQQARSAFSVIRTLNSYPPYNQRITYGRAAVNRPGDFNINTGYFVCRVPGVYYFVFHSTAKVSMCLRIASDALTATMGFCDYSRGQDQVLSGGVVLQLTAGQKVWLESFSDEQRASDARDSGEKQIIFNGFLITADS